MNKTLKFQWPTPIELRCRLRDVMDSDVDAKYYYAHPFTIIANDVDSSECVIVAMINHSSWHDISRRIYGINGIHPTVTASWGNTRAKVIIDEGKC